MQATTLTPNAGTDQPPGVWSRAFGGYEWIAKRQTLACAIVFVLTLGIRGALLPLFPMPGPSIHDEMSYLLASDTYASGRLANPPHAFWEHFETFHVLQQPTYASKYPPLQGLVLAAGQKLIGKPWAGVYVSVAVMCAAICWMLQGWITPNLAFLGGLLFMLRVGIFSYWMNSYWGGAVPAIGGALVLGAVARIGRRNQFGHAATWALGLAILMHSRPFDAGILGLSTGLVLVWWLGKSKVPFRTASVRIALPASAILAVSLVAVAHYDSKVTGNALTLPYQLHERQYVVAPMFAFMPLRPEPVYHHAEMRKLYTGWNVDFWTSTRADPVNASLSKMELLYGFFFGLWPLLIPPLIWPYSLKTTEERLTALLAAVFLTSVMALIAVQPHYAAAVAGLFYLRFLQTLARLHTWRPGGKPVGFALAVFFVTLFGYQFTSELSNLARFGTQNSHFEDAHQAVMKTLDTQPGRQLVLVRYSPDHIVHEEWVYNRANIDAAPVVWAREMGPAQDRPFVEYFHDRHVWLLEPDQSPPKLTPYSVDKVRLAMAGGR